MRLVTGGAGRTLVLVAAAAAAACQKRAERPGSTGAAPSAGAATSAAAPGGAADRIVAGGVAPAANALGAPRPARLDPDAGATLFSSMNCDGCHGGGAIGWVGPSLVDGRWRYGGSDEEIFTSIFYGRPKGMPAYGGVLGTDGVWVLVAYLEAQAVPTVVPTTSWLPGGNASDTPPPPTPPGAASEEKASPSGAEQQKADRPEREQQ
jgi:cytochrome c oxidase cbb3-type subunit 3